MDDTPKTARNSPLYTPPAEAERKAKLIRQLGPDRDGAYRAYGRIDGADSNKAKG